MKKLTKNTIFDISIDNNTFHIDKIHESKFIICCDEKILGTVSNKVIAFKILTEHLGSRLNSCLNIIKLSINNTEV